MTTVRLRRARLDEASTLSELALAAKRHWGYDEEFLDSCRAELTFSPDDIARRRIVVVDLGGTVAGCYSIDGEPPVGELGDMWVAPSRIGTGLGRVMWHDAMTTAAAAGFEHLEIAADPNAEGFYRKLGAERVGEAPSRSIPGRRLPLLRVRVGPRNRGDD